MNHVAYHEIARAERAARLALPADPAALVALLERDAMARDKYSSELADERDELKACLELARAAKCRADITLRCANEALDELRSLLCEDEQKDIADKLGGWLDTLCELVDEIGVQTAV